MRLLILLLAFLPSLAFAQAAQYIATPTTFRAVSEAVRKAGEPAVVTCTPGLTYPVFVRSNVGAYTFAKFPSPVIFKCAGATFVGSGDRNEIVVAGAENITLDGAIITGRLVFSGFKNVAVRNVIFPEGGGVMARTGRGLTVERLTIVKSAAAISLLDVFDATIRTNLVTDFSGNAGISAYGGGDIRILDNVVTGTRRVAAGVHPDGIQTASAQFGTVEISYNTVVLPGQGVFGGGTPDLFIAKQNYIQVDFPNALTWKSRQPAQIGGNEIRKLPSELTWVPRMFNYGTREGLAAAIDTGGNVVMNATAIAK